MQTRFDPFVETLVPSDELIISRTDLSGKITYANETFALISGYEIDELIGKPHNIVRHPDMPRSIFKGLWHRLHTEGSWSGYVKNLRKDGGYYWVYAEISGVYKDGVLIEYKSLRAPVQDDKKREVQALYDELKVKEEGVIRVVTYLNTQSVQKIKTLALEKQCDEDELINDILNDSLF